LKERVLIRSEERVFSTCKETALTGSFAHKNKVEPHLFRLIIFLDDAKEIDLAGSQRIL